ncbi:MAG TPA: NfeD family protein [Aquihabitans sp.]|nr:NfeD family protein [Aquihabitans sp.]
MLATALTMLAVVLGLAGPVAARSLAPAQSGGDDAGRVSILKVEGLIDPVMADFIERSVHAGEDAGVVAVVLQLDSADAVVDDDVLVDLARTIHDAEVPVAVWVGPSGSSARGKAAQLVGAADPIGIAPGARLGKTGPLVIPEELLSPAFVDAADRLEGGTVNAAEAAELGIVETEDAPVIGEFLIDLPGFETKTVKVEGRTVRQPVTTPVFSSLSVDKQLFHTVASPAAAYLLLVIGLGLIIFEFFTAGVGVAGLVGAGSLVLSCYGLAILPVRPWAVALLVLAMFGFAVDVQTGVPRLWSGIGFVSLLIGSLTLYDGFSLSWITLLVGIGGTTLAMVGGMPAMVRTRFSTPTIGREWMIGEEGEAVTNISPDGVVRVRGALWRARTNRATPIDLRDAIRVVEVDGLLLEVEPLEGGAVDHRARRGGGEEAGTHGAADDGVVLVDGEPLDPS